MENPNLQRRTELVLALQTELTDIDLRLNDAATAIGSQSCAFYEKAFKEKQDELRIETEEHHRNNERVREINNEITSAINSWYGFVKNTGEIEKLAFPIRYYFKKRSLLKNIGRLNAEKSDITIKNRFITEKLMILEHQIEIEAMVLAKSGDSYNEYEKLLQRRELLAADLKYLSSTIKGID